MQGLIRKEEGFTTRDRSRQLFGALLLSLFAVACLLFVIGSNGKAAFAVAPVVRAGSNGNISEGSVGAEPALSLTGKLVFQIRGSNYPNDALATIKADGTDFRVIFEHAFAFGPQTPEWSRDGRKILFRLSGDIREGAPETSPMGNTNIVTVDADGSNLTNLTQGTQEGSEPSWSPDGSMIAFENSNDIHVMDSNGGNIRQITDPKFNNFSFWPAWKPDGTKIAYIELLGPDDSNIVIVNPDGSAPVIIPNPTPDFLFQVVEWSPDGTQLAVAATADNTTQNHVYIMNADGTNMHRLTTGLSQSNQPTWSPDGNWLAVVGRVTQSQILMPIYIVSKDGLEVTPLFTPATGESVGHPSWGLGGPAAIVRVHGEDGSPVPGAQVFKNCDLVGTTNVSGTLVLPGTLFEQDELIARAAVFTGTTQKGSHDGWAYQVWLTNILQNNDGTESPYVITDTERLTHTLKLLPTNAQIGFNLVASVEYNTTDEHLSQIEQGFKAASEYLMDVTDGQMFFENVKIYEEGQHFADADFQFAAWHPRASANAEPDGISALTDPDQHIYMHGPNDFNVPYNQFNAYTTFIHEFGHYALGAYDEYYKWNSDDYPTSCTVSFDDPYDVRASIMYQHAEASEFCATISPLTHNHDTAHGYIQGESVWETLVDNWSSDEGLWELRSPMTRGTVNKGPVFVSCSVTLGTNVRITTVAGAACAPLGITADFPDELPAVGADVSIKHGSTYFYMAPVDSIGISTLVGASVGDTVFVSTLVGGVAYNAKAVISGCHGIALVLNPGAAPQLEVGESASSTAGGGTWPAHWVTAVPNWVLNQINVTLHFAAEPPSTPMLYAGQSAGSRQQVALTHNAGDHTYTGTYAFNASGTPDFQFDVELPMADGVSTSVHRFLAGQFHTTGPSGYEKMKNLGVPHGNDPAVAPVAWGLMRPESMADVVVEPSSLPEGTGVMVGEAGTPQDAPTGLIAVGGPYSVEGQNPINGDVGITVEYLSEYYCGLEPGSISIYRHTGTGWQAMPTNIIEEWHQAGTTITEWGIYGVFAQPNAQTSFSDVEPGSTFFDYISWMTCHGIASGYSDNTFRPSNNATRGQISKMMALAYSWRLDPDGTNGYTFADVMPGHTFFEYVEAAYREGVVNGYPCGGAGEPCDAENRPYFRPANNVTRGQISKIIANGSKFADPVAGQTFEDVAPGSTFYEFVERMASRTIINGYPCGGQGEPCGAGNKPYFRPGANATRGQLSKMIYIAAQPK